MFQHLSMLKSRSSMVPRRSMSSFSNSGSYSDADVLFVAGVSFITGVVVKAIYDYEKRRSDSHEINILTIETNTLKNMIKTQDLKRESLEVKNDGQNRLLEAKVKKIEAQNDSLMAAIALRDQTYEILKKEFNLLKNSVTDQNKGVQAVSKSSGLNN